MTVRAHHIRHKKRNRLYGSFYLDVIGAFDGALRYIFMRDEVSEAELAWYFSKLQLEPHHFQEFLKLAASNALDQAGGNYYPKLLVAIPFTPVSGPRLLVRDKENSDLLKNIMIEHIIEIVKQMTLNKS